MLNSVKIADQDDCDGAEQREENDRDDAAAEREDLSVGHAEVPVSEYSGRAIQ